MIGIQRIGRTALPKQHQTVKTIARSIFSNSTALDSTLFATRNAPVEKHSLNKRSCGACSNCHCKNHADRFQALPSILKSYQKFSPPLSDLTKTVPQVRAFSTAPRVATSEDLAINHNGSATLNALDMGIVRQIKSELMEVDANFDGRLDADELKKLLNKHNSTFSDEEILEISDLYYASKAGGSVSFERFIEAVDLAVTKNQEKDQDKGNTAAEGLDAPHFKDGNRHPLGAGSCAAEFMYAGKSHGHYTAEELDVKLTHTEPQGFRDRLAFNSVKAVRFLFDTATGWRNDNITPENIMHRVIYLETIAAVPGMVAAIVRHFKSLRNMERDGGMLQMFLEEANNERMHLLTFVGMKNPGKLFRLAVLGGQVGFGSVFLLAYILSPKFCHRFVGYVEEEACSTYTKIIKAIEEAPEGSELEKWQTELAPKIAIAYWKLGEKGSILDLMYAVRADEAEHRDVNHLVCGMKPGQVNPLYDPQQKLDQMLLRYAKDIMKANTAN